MNIEWKPVVGYEGFYEISDNGEIKSLIKNRLLKPCIHKKGYLVVTLTKGNAHKQYYVHRLWAAAFLDNDDSLKEVNHNCDFAETNCPDTVGVACWEQYLSHIDEKENVE